jgi:hypothetical protein
VQNGPVIVHPVKGCVRKGDVETALQADLCRIALEEGEVRVLVWRELLPRKADHIFRKIETNNHAVRDEPGDAGADFAVSASDVEDEFFTREAKLRDQLLRPLELPGGMFRLILGVPVPFGLLLVLLLHDGISLLWSLIIHNRARFSKNTPSGPAHESGRAAVCLPGVPAS